MFRASLCPSSGALDRILLHTVFSTSSAENRITVCSNIRSSAPEDGHNYARNMLSQ